MYHWGSLWSWYEDYYYKDQIAFKIIQFPFLKMFGSSFKDKGNVTLDVCQNYLFEGFIISDKAPTQLNNMYSE